MTGWAKAMAGQEGKGTAGQIVSNVGFGASVYLGHRRKKKFFNDSNFPSLGGWGKDVPTNGTNT